KLSDHGVFRPIVNRRMPIGGEDGAVAGNAKIMRRVAGRCRLGPAMVEISLMEFRLLGVSPRAGRPFPDLRRDRRVGLPAEVTEGFLHLGMQGRDPAFTPRINRSTRWRPAVSSTSRRSH